MHSNRIYIETVPIAKAITETFQYLGVILIEENALK